MSTIDAWAQITTPTMAAQEWLALETDRFTVVSALNARDTARWASDFARFVNGLQRLIPVNERRMPPLTAVLFRREGSFAPYRLRFESGVAVSTAGTASPARLTPAACTTTSSRSRVSRL